MNQAIEGFNEAAPEKIDRRTREYRETMRPATADVRGSARPDSVREAEIRAQEIIDSLGDSIYQSDEFFIDVSAIPEGWAYQWRRQSVAGKEDPHYMVGLQRNGWKAVPASRHPEMMPIGWTGAIEKKGLILMELPKILVDRATAAAKREAVEQIRNSEAMLHEAPANTGSRDPELLRQLGRTGAKREFSIPIPAET